MPTEADTQPTMHSDRLLLDCLQLRRYGLGIPEKVKERLAIWQERFAKAGAILCIGNVGRKGLLADQVTGGNVEILQRFGQSSSV